MGERLSPRFFKHWDQNMGLRARMQMQAQQVAEHARGVLDKVVSSPAHNREVRAHRELLEITNFINRVSVSIQNLGSKEEIFDAAMAEFSALGKYSITFFELMQEGKLKVSGSSLFHKNQKLLNMAETLVGQRIETFTIDPAGIGIYLRALAGEVVHTSSAEVVKSVINGPGLSKLIEVLAIRRRNVIVAPLKLGREVMGLMALSSVELSKQFAPSVEGLAQHISGAIGRTEANAKLRESEERFRQFFEHSPDLCYMISPKGEILDVNIKTLCVLGYMKEAIVGKPLLRTIYAPESREKAQRIFERWSAGKEIENEELVVLTASGERRTVLLNVGAIRDKKGGLISSVSIQTDITERKREGQALENQRLRNAKLKIANRTLLMAADWLSQLWSGVMGNLELVKMEFDALAREVEGVRAELLPEKYDAIMERLKAARESIGELSPLAERGGLVIKDIREFAGMRRKLHLTSTDINKVIEGAVSESGGQVMFERRGALAAVKTDPACIGGAISRFIKNALAASAKVGNGRVVIGTAQKRYEIEISIEDNGIRYGNLAVGILREPPSIHGKTFNYEEYLSLSIAVKHIEAHGGKVYFDNKQGTGRIVKIWLPIEVPFAKKN